MNWRELLAGGEGYLTERGRRGLWKHPVAWGDMVCDHANRNRIQIESASRANEFTLVVLQDSMV